MAVVLNTARDYERVQAAVNVAMTSIVRLQSHAPLSQSSVARPAARDHGRRLITSRGSALEVLHRV